MKQSSGALTFVFVVLMIVGGLYEIIYDQAVLGGLVWVIGGLILLPPVQAFSHDYLGLKIPAPLSLLIFVMSFLGGLLLMSGSS